MSSASEILVGHVRTRRSPALISWSRLPPLTNCDQEDTKVKTFMTASQVHNFENYLVSSAAHYGISVVAQPTSVRACSWPSWTQAASYLKQREDKNFARTSLFLPQEFRLEEERRRMGPPRNRVLQRNWPERLSHSECDPKRSLSPWDLM